MTGKISRLKRVEKIAVTMKLNLDLLGVLYAVKYMTLNAISENMKFGFNRCGLKSKLFNKKLMQSKKVRPVVIADNYIEHVR
jgi:hypothetical protein